MRISMLVLAAVVFCVSGISFGGTRLVPGQYPTIQEAIDAAAVSGDTIIVSAGTYYENIDMLGKAITLTSTDPSNPAVVALTVTKVKVL